MNTLATTPLTELQEFVLNQAEKDATLPLDERIHQAEIVSDVLSQEASTPKNLKKLLREYRVKLEQCIAKSPTVKI